jgi:hypothetical protein
MEVNNIVVNDLLQTIPTVFFFTLYNAVIQFHDRIKTSTANLRSTFVKLDQTKHPKRSSSIALEVIRGTELILRIEHSIDVFLNRIESVMEFILVNSGNIKSIQGTMPSLQHEPKMIGTDDNVGAVWDGKIHIGERKGIGDVFGDQNDEKNGGNVPIYGYHSRNPNEYQSLSGVLNDKPVQVNSGLVTPSKKGLRSENLKNESFKNDENNINRDTNSNVDNSSQFNVPLSIDWAQLVSNRLRIEDKKTKLDQLDEITNNDLISNNKTQNSPTEIIFQTNTQYLPITTNRTKKDFIQLYKPSRYSTEALQSSICPTNQSTEALHSSLPPPTPPPPAPPPPRHRAPSPQQP